MLKISLDSLGPSGAILCLGAHCDDVEIGCGATLIDLVTRFPDLVIHVIVFCSDERREAESRQSFVQLLDNYSNLKLEFATFRDGYLPYQAGAVKDYLATRIKGLSPDLIFTHFRQDLHQDHSFIGDITFQLFRDELILEMEIPKYDGDLGRPNLYLPSSAIASKRKVSALAECYKSQTDKHWFSEDTFNGLMRIRGLECRSPSGLAEAFHVSKLVLT